MGTSLAGLLPQNTYSGLIKFGDNAALSASLKAISDGAGNDTMLSISTTALQIGGATGLNWDNTNKSLGIGTSAPVGILHLYKSAAATRLAIDGDAGQNRLISYRTGAVQRFGLYVNNTAESGSNAGSNFAIRAYSDAGTLLSTPLFIERSTGNVGVGTTTPASPLSIVNTIALAAGATNPRIENIAYTINNSGAQTGTATGIFLNATETALNGQTHNLIDLQKGGSTQFKVDNVGQGFVKALFLNDGFGSSLSTNVLTLYGGVGNTITGQATGGFTFGNKINLSGTTSSFPAIKRNGAAIDFRLADDSGFANISANNANLGSATIGSRLSVRGDSTNPIARFESSLGAMSLAINALGDTYNFGSGGNIMYIVNQNGSSTINGKALAWYANIDTFAGFCFSFNDNNTQSYTSGSGGMLAISNAVFSSAAGSANFRPMSIQYTLNALGAQTGTATGIFMNATETDLNGLTHNLMDLQVGGASRFKVSNAGEISIGNTVASAVAVASTHKVTVVIGGTTYYLLATNV